MMKPRVPAFVLFVLITALVALLSLVGLQKVRPDLCSAEAAQVVVLFVTVVMLVAVWVQLAVQTVIGVLGTAQDEGIRLTRQRLFDAEDEHRISKLCSSANAASNQWKKCWQQDADHVAQSWNTVGYLLHIDPVANLLLRKYIRATRRAILKSRYIAQPRIAERRDLIQHGQPGLWEDFDWLATKAAGFLQQGELQAWGLPNCFRDLLRSRSLSGPGTQDARGAGSGPPPAAQPPATAAG